MRLLHVCTLILPLLATAACGDTVYINDSIDLDFDFSLTKPRVDADLTTPYVVGSKITITISDSDEDVEVGRWHAVSEDPSVFAINDVVVGDKILTLHCRSTGGGRTSIVVYDGDHERARALVEVGVPDRVDLDAHAWMIIGRNDQARVDEARIVEGGTATYLVRYFAGERELHGNGALAFEAADNVTAEARTSFLFEEREWLTLTAAAPGTSSMKLGANTTIVNAVPVVVVPATDIDRVEIHGSDESHAKKDDYLVALAQAFDAQDRRIFGVEYSWSVDDVAAVGDGDLYRYQFKPGEPAMLVADDGTHAAAAQLHVGEGFVDSSNNVGCAIAAPGRHPRDAALGGLGLAAIGLALFVERRGRRRRGQ
jgi:hypothetical protein